MRAALLVASLESVGAVDCSPGSGFLPGTAFCAKCPKGTFGGGNLCTRCPAGRWSNQEGASEQDVCKLCSAGKWGSQVGAISEDACMACPHGRWGAQQGAAAVEQCTACPAGRWSDLLGSSSNSSCRACLPGRYGPDVGQLSQDACHRCPAGRWRSTPGGASAESCQKCPAGTWSDVQGATAASCQSCGLGRWSDTEGAFSSTFCRLCIQGRYNDLPGASREAACLPCQRGRWWEGQLGANSSACHPCPEGRYQPGLAQVGRFSCLPCAPGNFSGNVSGACRSCPVGSWSGLGASKCNVCEEGWSRVPGAVGPEMCSDCEGQCQEGSDVTIRLQIENLDCGNLTAKQRDDLAAAYANEMAIHLVSSLSGAESKVALTPHGTSCEAQGVFQIPEGSTLQSLSHPDLRTLQSLLRGSAALAGVQDPEALVIAEVAMLPTAFTSPKATTAFLARTGLTTTFRAANTSTTSWAVEVDEAGKSSGLGHWGYLLLGAFLGLAACLCCLELFHTAWKGPGRRMVSGWLRSERPGNTTDSENSESSVDEEEVSAASSDASATRTRL